MNFKNSELVLLGTGGGPSIWESRSQPSSALVINNDIYIIDTGDGVASQMARAKLDPKAIKAIFVTHNHSDHVADFGTLLLRAWQTGHNGTIQCFGPPPLEKIANSYIEYMRWDIELRMQYEGRPDFRSIMDVRDIYENSHFFTDDNISVDCIAVPHGEAYPSYAYRFQIGTKSVVFSGDTSKSEALITFSKDVDILVHEILNTDGVEAIIERTYPGNESFKRHIIDGHTPMREVGEVASASGAKTLVLNHFVPTGSPILDKPEIGEEGVGASYGGNIIVGSDLLRIPI